MTRDNDSIHHARNATCHLDKHPRPELPYGARHSPPGNPAGQTWAALENYAASTAVTWPGRPRQVHSIFPDRSPSHMPDTAAP